MPRNTVAIVHTQLWRDRRVDEKYAPAGAGAGAAATSTRLSCGCCTNNAGLAAWCVLHSEQVHREESPLASLSSPAGGHDAREAREVPRICASRDDMLLLHFGQGKTCPLSQAFDCVGMTDSEREFLYRRLCEGVEEQRGGTTKPAPVGEPSSAPQGLVCTTDEEKYRQFQEWVWHELNGWVEYMYPDGSRRA